MLGRHHARRSPAPARRRLGRHRARTANGRSIGDLVADQLDVDAAMNQLSPLAAVALRDLVGLDYARSRSAGIPPGTVRSVAQSPPPPSRRHDDEGTKPVVQTSNVESTMNRPEPLSPETVDLLLARSSTATSKAPPSASEAIAQLGATRASANAAPCAA